MRSAFPARERNNSKNSIAISTIVDRVSPLNQNGTVSEVHSVAIKSDPFVYALGLVERERKMAQPDRCYLFELKDGDRFILSSDEVLERAIANG